MIYLERAFRLRSLVMSKIYGQRGVSRPDIDKLAALFAGIENSSELNGDRIGLLTGKSENYDCTRFEFRKETLQQLAKRRMSLHPPGAGEKEYEFIDRLRVHLGRRAHSIVQAAMLLRLIHPERYPMFGAYTRSSFFPLSGRDEVDTYVKFRDNMLALKRHHGVGLNVAQVEQAVWVIYMLQRHSWGDPREAQAIIKEYRADAFVRQLKVREVDLTEILGTDDSIQKGNFIETYNPRDAGKFYAEALETEVARIFQSKLKKPWGPDPRPFWEKLSELAACHPRIAELRRQLVSTWLLRNACVHPRPPKSKPDSYYRNIAQQILADYRIVKDIV